MRSQPVIAHFKDFPTLIDVRLYAQAATLYAQRVRARTLAVYQVGSVKYPGLSDLDLLLIVRNAKIDNVQFFSVYRQLPKSLHRLFLHEPFIVPLDCLDVLRFTSHTTRQLLRGEEIASAIKSESSSAESWCRLFEGLCTHQSFFDNVVKTETVRVRHMTAVANSLRFSLGFFDATGVTDLAEAYGGTLDALKRDLLADCLSEAVALQIFDLYDQTFQTLKQLVRARLSLPPHEDLIAFGRQFLKGERELPGVNVAWIRQRYQAIARYHSELDRLKLSYGYLFFLAAYEDVVKYRQNGFTARWLNAYYRLFAARD